MSPGTAAFVFSVGWLFFVVVVALFLFARLFPAETIILISWTLNLNLETFFFFLRSFPMHDF